MRIIGQCCECHLLVIVGTSDADGWIAPAGPIHRECAATQSSAVNTPENVEARRAMFRGLGWYR